MNLFHRPATALPLLALFLVLSGCGGPGSGANEDSGDQDGSEAVEPRGGEQGDPFAVGSESVTSDLEGFVIDYEGPDCGVILEGSKLRIRVEAPTGGHRLSFTEATDADGVVSVVCRLDEPNPETEVTQGLETLALDLDTGELSDREAWGYVIRIVRWVDGFQYLIPPESRIAAKLKR